MKGGGDDAYHTTESIYVCPNETKSQFVVRFVRVEQCSDSTISVSLCVAEYSNTVLLVRRRLESESRCSSILSFGCRRTSKIITEWVEWPAWATAVCFIVCFIFVAARLFCVTTEIRLNALHFGVTNLPPFDCSVRQCLDIPRTKL